MSWEERAEKARQLITEQQDNKIAAELQRQLEGQRLLEQAEEILRNLKVTEALEGIKLNYWQEGQVDTLEESVQYEGIFPGLHGTKLQKGIKLASNFLFIEVIGNVNSERMIELSERETALKVFMHPFDSESDRSYLYIREEGVHENKEHVDLFELVRRQGLIDGIRAAGDSYGICNWYRHKGGIIGYDRVDTNSSEARDRLDRLLMSSVQGRTEECSFPAQARARTFQLIDQLPSSLWADGFLSGPELNYWAIQNGLIESTKKHFSIFNPLQKKALVDRHS